MDIVFVYCGVIGSLTIKKDPFCIPYELARLGFNITAVVSSGSIGIPGCDTVAVLRPLDVTLYRKLSLNTLLRLFKIIQIFNFLSILRTIRSKNPQVVITYYYPLIIILLGLYRKFSKNHYKIVCKMDWDGVIRGSAVRRFFYKLVLLLTWSLCDVVIIESYEALKNVVRILPCMVGKVRVIWNGYSDKLLKVPEDITARVRERMVLTVARVEPVKGIHNLILAFAKVVRRYGDWKLVIVGPINNKRYYDCLQKLVKQLKIDDKVVFLGEIPDDELTHIYMKASIFVLPSYVEGFSIARVEALAYGLPIITTATGGSEIVRGVGLIVKPGDIDGLAEALEKLISNDVLRASLSEAALNRAKELTWRKSAERVVEIIKCML
jgi:glycosyltransferase involved in cell wall biosynthesis